MGMANAMKTMKIIGTALLTKRRDMASLNPYFLVMVSPGFPGRSSECVDDHSIRNDESHNIGYVTVNNGVDNRRGHRENTLKQDCPDDHVGNVGLVGTGATDENGGDCGECHEEGAVIERNKPIALFIQENTDGSINSRQENRRSPHPVDTDAAGTCVVWIRADGSHCCSGFRVKECTHYSGHEDKKQDGASRNHEGWTDVDGQEVVQDLTPEPTDSNGGSEALAAVAPNHRRTVIRQDHPHDAHEGYRRETDVGGDHHLVALDVVEQNSISPAEYQCEENGDDDG